MKVRWLGVKGRLSSGISDVDVTISSPGLADLPEIVAPDYAIIVLDPDSVAGRPEVVRVTAHTASATSATVERGSEQLTGGSPARSHASNMNWYHAATPKDFEGMVPASLVDAAGDLLVGSAADTVARLAMGTASQVLSVNSGATGLEWAAASGGGAAPMASPNNQGAVQWDVPGATFTATTNEGFLANTVYYQPFVVAAGRTVTISAIGIRVHTLGASGHAILGCYAATSLLQPTGASLFSSGVLDTSTTGVKQTTGLSVTLGEGVYLISLGLDVNVRLYVMRGPGIPGGQGFYNWDYSIRAFQRSRTYDGTNPNPSPDWNDNGLGNGFDHFVGLKYTVGTA